MLGGYDLLIAEITKARSVSIKNTCAIPGRVGHVSVTRDAGAVPIWRTAMATRQTSKRAKTKAEAKVDTGGTIKPNARSERELQPRNARARPRPAAARTDRAGATAAAAPKASLNGSEMVHDKSEPARLRSKPVAEAVDLGTTSVSGAEQPPASTKRAQLIAMLERAEGASVAEIGQRLGWLPHTVRAAITGLRKAGREVRAARMPMTGPCTGWLLSKLPPSGDGPCPVDKTVLLRRRSHASPSSTFANFESCGAGSTRQRRRHGSAVSC